MNSPRAILKKGMVGSIFGHHPWVMENQIASQEGEFEPGCVTELADETGKTLGWGIWNPASKIRFRVYSFGPTNELAGDWVSPRLKRAIQLRHAVGLMVPHGACRLVNSEGDALSGLIVDRYADVLVIQLNSLSMAERCEEIIHALQTQLPGTHPVIRADAHAMDKEGFTWDQEAAALSIPPSPKTARFVEHEIAYHVDFSGQKTGFFLDQRDHRSRVGSLSHLARVLDLYCYSGGFSLNAARGGATQVTAVDSSEDALRWAKTNAEINEYTRVTWQHDDVFQFLKSLSESERFNVVISDPPKFAKTRKDKENALRKYFALNELAMKRVAQEGFLMTFSCSGAVSSSEFEEMVTAVARRQKRNCQIIARLGPSPDHPVMTSCPEGHYLKGLLCHL